MSYYEKKHEIVGRINQNIRLINYFQNENVEKYETDLLQAIRELIEHMLDENGLCKNLGAILHMSYKIFCSIRNLNVALESSGNGVYFDSELLYFRLSPEDVDIDGEHKRHLRLLIRTVLYPEMVYKDDILIAHVMIYEDGSFSGYNTGLGLMSELTVSWNISFSENGLPKRSEYYHTIDTTKYFQSELRRVVSTEYGADAKKEISFVEDLLKKSALALDETIKCYNMPWEHYLCFIPGLTETKMHADSQHPNYGMYSETIKQAFPELVELYKEKRV